MLAKFHEDRIKCAQFRNVEIRENEALETQFQNLEKNSSCTYDLRKRRKQKFVGICVIQSLPLNSFTEFLCELSLFYYYLKLGCFTLPFFCLFTNIAPSIL